MKKVYRAHPLMFWKFTKPYLFVLLFPVVRAILQYLHLDRINGLLRNEIIFIAIIIIFAFLRCFAFKVICFDDSIVIRSGIFFVKRAKIDFNKLSSVQTVRNPFDLIFNAMTFRVNTEAGEQTKSDYEFKLKWKDAKELSGILYGSDTVSKQHFSAFKVALMAAATSSAFTGILIGVPIINYAGRLLGIAISDLLWNEINNVSSKIETHFPPIVNAISLVFLLALVISFIYSFLKFVNFKIVLGEKRIEVRSGLITTFRTAFNRNSIIDVKLEQTALMLLLKRYSMKVCVGGFGDSKSESQIMVPSGKLLEIRRIFSFYFPFLTLEHKFIKPKHSFLNKTRFLYWPGLYLLLILGISIPLCIIFDEFEKFIFFLTLVALAFDFYYAYICYWQFLHCKLSLGNTIFARSKTWLRTRDIYCPKERVGQIKITRFFTDFIYKQSKVRITVCSETADSIKLSHLDYEPTKQAILECFNLNE